MTRIQLPASHPAAATPSTKACVIRSRVRVARAALTTLGSSLPATLTHVVIAPHTCVAEGAASDACGTHITRETASALGAHQLLVALGARGSALVRGVGCSRRCVLPRVHRLLAWARCVAAAAGILRVLLRISPPGRCGLEVCSLSSFVLSSSACSAYSSFIVCFMCC